MNGSKYNPFFELALSSVALLLKISATFGCDGQIDIHTRRSISFMQLHSISHKVKVTHTTEHQQESFYSINTYNAAVLPTPRLHS